MDTADFQARLHFSQPVRQVVLMILVLALDEACYNRNKYFEEAWAVVEEIKKRGKIPVIVGGTNYYLETLLYDAGISQKE